MLGYVLPDGFLRRHLFIRFGFSCFGLRGGALWLYVSS
jgi:hypothetical protein